MNIAASFTLFILMIVLYGTISEMFTILFRFTGLPDEKARFQVISLLTGCGFTTRESEMFLSTRSRRRLARITMLFGYVFNITIVSTLINVFLAVKQTDAADFLWGIPVPLAEIALIVALIRTPKIRSWVENKIHRLAKKMIRGESDNTVLLIDYIGADSIAQVALEHVPEEMQNVRLADTGLKTEKNILVMLLERGGGKAVPPTADTVFQDGDKLTVFGSYDNIRQVFHAKEQFVDN